MPVRCLNPVHYSTYVVFDLNSLVVSHRHVVSNSYGGMRHRYIEWRVVV